jgi:hypothetical protein
VVGRPAQLGFTDLGNYEFKTHRTSEELKTQFEAMRHYFNPATPDSSKPRWARGSRNHKLQSTLFPLSRTSQEWTPEEEDWLCQRRTGKADWKDIGAEIAVKFGTQRTTQALQARLGVIRARAPQMANPRIQQWTTQQDAWLVQEAAGPHALAIDWDNMASLFETRFGFRHTTQSLKGQYNKLRKRGDLTGHKHVKAAPATECKVEEAHG